MAKKRKLRKPRRKAVRATIRPETLEIGEYAELASPFGLPPRGVYRVDGVCDDMLMFSIGEFSGAVNFSMVDVFCRNLPEPKDALLEEIKYLEKSIKRCDCEDCRKLLETKKAQHRKFSVDTDANIYIQ